MKNPILPDWYSISNEIKQTELKAKKKNAAIHTARRVLGRLGETLAIQLSGANIPSSWLSEIDAAAKSIGVILLIIAITSTHSIIPLIIILAAIIIAILSAKIKAKQIWIIWMSVPLFSLGIILPSMLNIFTPGEIAIKLLEPGAGKYIFGMKLPETIGITTSGIILAIRFLLRVTACVTLTTLLTSTTDQAMLINGFRRLGMPKIFGMTLSMMQRYLSVILLIAEEIYMAKLSRTITGGSVSGEQKWAAAGIGSLFRKTHYLTEQVHNAMVSRGYDGNMVTIKESSIKTKDYLWIASSVIISCILVISDRIFFN